MNRLNLFFLVFCMSLVVPLCGQSSTNRIDSILASPRDTHQVRELSALIVAYIDNRKTIPDTVFDHGITLASELNDDEALAAIYLDCSIYYLNVGEVEKGLLAVEHAIKHATALGFYGWVERAYMNKVELLLIGGRTKESAELASSLAKEYLETDNPYCASSMYRMLGMLSSGLGDHELTMKYDSLAIALARENGYEDIVSRTLFSASVNSSLLGFPERALALAEEALKVAEENELKIDGENARSARAEANTALGNYKEALQDYDFLKVGKLEEKFPWRMTNKGLLLQRIGQHDESRALLLEAAQLIAESTRDPVEFKRCYQALQTVGLNKAQYDSVAWYGKLMEAEQDSLQTAKNIKNLLDLEEKYKAEEKGIEIQLQQEQIARQKLQLYATIFGLLLALAGVTIFFFLSRRLKKRNTEKEQLLADKEVLIGEIHHRVKNNLQVVSSLLQLQRRDLDSDDAQGREALLESQSRVGAMGLIHNKLYQGEEVTSVHMPEYLKDLGETLIDAYRVEEQVDIFYDVEDISLDVDIAIPLGLIINELVTNSMKYAFPKGREGTIEIALHRDNGQLLLAVTDDGVGAAAAEKRADSTSFGTNLIGLLTKKIRGSLRILEERGYGVEITFPE